MRLYDRRLTPGTRITILLIVAIAGLLYVKWMPHYHKAFLVRSMERPGAGEELRPGRPAAPLEA